MRVIIVSKIIVFWSVCKRVSVGEGGVSVNLFQRVSVMVHVVVRLLFIFDDSFFVIVICSDKYESKCHVLLVARG